MQVGRRWYWLGAAVAVAGAVLMAGVPLGTLLTIAALLACPAAMFFGMGMMSRTGATTQGRRMACHGDPGRAERDRGQGGSAAAAPAEGRSDDGGQTTQPSKLPDGLDPLAILKIRLAKGEIALDEYERLMTAVLEPQERSRRAQAPQVGMSDHV